MPYIGTPAFCKIFLVLSNVSLLNVSTPVDISSAFYAKTIDGNVYSAFQRGRIHYIEVDLRDTTDAPLLGSYFLTGDFLHKPMSVTSLLKYENRTDVGRIFDNGHIIIYDVRRLRRAADE